MNPIELDAARRPMLASDTNRGTRVLELISVKSEVAATQRDLFARLTGRSSRGENRNIGYPGGNSNHQVYPSRVGGFYYAYSEPRHQSGIARHWNSFGIYVAGQSPLSIVVEINIPRDAPDARVGGFFARDPDTGVRYLMHTGAIGGGRPGISQARFLEALPEDRVPVAANGRLRWGLVIGPLDDDRLIGGIARFVGQVEAFKTAVTGGRPITLGPTRDDGDDNGDERDYTAEFYGWKRGTRTPVFDYFSYHGMIVDALYADRRAARTAEEHVGRDRLVDLFVSRKGRRVEVYEVKTSAGRQALYTAIGQLMVHGGGADVLRWLIVPARETLPADCKKALAALDIRVREYEIAGTAHKAKIRLR